ncbi:hypothetical protein [Endozoicomonas lisbonensis]|uniref:Uncharacterized protein n=1 Tax=Endozoicomonas lisbonensis TaxID=3120522 RepID=A0ABV2SR20_9GAMM
MNELDYLLGLDSQGIKTHSQAEALNNRIRDWFANPVGTIADQPEWGSNHQYFQFSAEGSDTEAMMEMTLIPKLRMDLKGISIRGVRVSWQSIHECMVTLLHQFGTVTVTVGGLTDG